MKIRFHHKRYIISLLAANELSYWAADSISWNRVPKAPSSHKVEWVKSSIWTFESKSKSLNSFHKFFHFLQFSRHFDILLRQINLPLSFLSILFVLLWKFLPFFCFTFHFLHSLSCLHSFPLLVLPCLLFSSLPLSVLILSTFLLQWLLLYRISTLSSELFLLVCLHVLNCSFETFSWEIEKSSGCLFCLVNQIHDI